VPAWTFSGEVLTLFVRFDGLIRLWTTALDTVLQVGGKEMVPWRPSL
jgi:hypothetical protein